MRDKKNCFFLLCFLISIYAYAQKTITPERITIEDGLSQGYVSSIIQDEKGFLWMGTKNGLDRYDGEQFKNFSEEIKAPYNFKSESIIALRGGDGFILIGTESGISFYQKSTKRFFSLNFQTIQNHLKKNQVF
ncbi:two-component regulator propeller domain-containing protein [uncultured Lacinutrix sp.]|uniref:ligand-binding sensor domain-containing protein n=1 Tax=uncultured Lacinutrix sp. TaxID=574032 RepID=UPI00260F29BF|nr:two-component regulator propeller domain-containing protein [uncultured Lacinutrix sp.]